MWVAQDFGGNMLMCVPLGTRKTEGAGGKDFVKKLYETSHLIPTQTRGLLRTRLEGAKTKISVCHKDKSINKEMVKSSRHQQFIF